MRWFDETVTVGGVLLRGRFLMESGPFGHSGASIVACMEAGFSAVSTETISLADGTSPWWNIWQEGRSLYNCSKWSDITLKQWVEREIPYAVSRGAVIMATVGHTATDAEQIVPALEGSGITGIKACTYQADEIVGIVRTAKRHTTLPVWAKISANWPNFLELARACEMEGAEALVAIDTLGPVAFQRIGVRPALGSADGSGWLSGEAIHGRALYIVERLRERVSVPIVGVGGVLDAEGAQRMRSAGADLIGICSATLLYGLGHLKTIQEDLRNQPGWEFRNQRAGKEAAHIQVDRMKCDACGACAARCGYLALRIEQGRLETEDTACRRCGICQQICPAIQIESDV